MAPHLFRLIMTINQLWYLLIFAWGILCGWAVIQGMRS